MSKGIAIREAGTAQDDNAISLSQARGILAFGLAPMIMNGVVCLIILVVQAWDLGLKCGYVPAWATVNLAVLMARMIDHIRAQAYIDDGGDPRTALLRLALGSLFAGLSWAILPFCMGPINIHGGQAYVFLIMYGVAVATMVRGIPHAGVALCFALPPIFATAILLALTGVAGDDVLAGGVLFLGLLMIKAARISQENFISAVVSGLEAQNLAASLQAANRDIQASNERLEILANRDHLTGLANRGRFNEQLERDLARAEEQDTSVALILLDLNRFKSINDRLGHSAGDVLLVEIARRLRHAVGAQGLAARLGGDEFAVLCSGPEAEAAAEAISARFLEAMDEPVVLVGKAFDVSACLGMAVFPSHAGDATDLLAFADLALYEAKGRYKAKGCLTIFSAALRRIAERHRQIERDIRDAIRNGEIEAWFQPQVVLADRSLSGLEALVRWKHPTLGPISPEEMVHAAEAAQVLHLLTGAVAEQACQMYCALRRRGLGHVGMAINVSPREFSLYSVADMMDEITGRYGIDPAALEIEFTEETLLNANLIAEELRKLESAGYTLTLDDFGMGHSSLTYLVSMKVGRLKIDRSFVREIRTSHHHQALVTTIVGLGHMMAIPVVVEGIEDEEDVQTLRLLGCHTGQGYAFGRPMPAAQVLEWITERPQKIA